MHKNAFFLVFQTASRYSYYTINIVFMFLLQIQAAFQQKLMVYPKEYENRKVVSYIIQARYAIFSCTVT